MYYRLQRQNSFGPYETKSTLVISRSMELKILDGESSIPNASPVVLESINKSLEGLINSHDRTKTVVHELPDFVKNTIISHCDLSEKELIDKRYGEYFEGYSLANNVQYIPVEIECLSNLDPDLCKSILALFVSVVFEYITEDQNNNVFELIKWGSDFLQRIGKILNLNENEVSTIIRPVSESLELKQLGMNFDDLRVEKQIHVNHILEHLEPMQENIDEFFKQTMGTFDDDNDYDFNEDDYKDDDNLFKNQFEDPFKFHERVDHIDQFGREDVVKDHFDIDEYLHEDKDLKKKDKKHSSKEKESKKKEKKESSKKTDKKEKEDVLDYYKESEHFDIVDEFKKYDPLKYNKMQIESLDNQEFFEVEMETESEDEEEAYFKKHFVDNYKPKKKKSKELFDIKDLMSLLEPDVEEDILIDKEDHKKQSMEENEDVEMERNDQEDVENGEADEVELEEVVELNQTEEDDLNRFESLDTVEEEVINKMVEQAVVMDREDEDKEGDDREKGEEKDNNLVEEEFEEFKSAEPVENVDKEEQEEIRDENSDNTSSRSDNTNENQLDVEYQHEQEDIDKFVLVEQVVVVDREEYNDTIDKLELEKEEREKDDKENKEIKNAVKYDMVNAVENDEEDEVEYQENVETEEENSDNSSHSSSNNDINKELDEDMETEEEEIRDDIDEEREENYSTSSRSDNTNEDDKIDNMGDLYTDEDECTDYTVPRTPRNTLVQQEDKEVVGDNEDEQSLSDKDVLEENEYKEEEKEEYQERELMDEEDNYEGVDNEDEENDETDEVELEEVVDDEGKNENDQELVMDLADLKIEEPMIDRQMSESGLTESSKTNMGDVEQEEEEEDLLKILERSLKHKSSLPTNDYDNLLNDISNLNLPPKKNKSITSKIISNISKKINRVFSINSEKSSRMPYTSSMQPGVNFYPNQDYLNNLLLIEKSPYVVAVLIRNLVLKYIISGYNDSRVQVVFERFGNLLGVSSSSVLSIENNIVSDLAGILDVSAAKTTSKKMSKRLKILSATVGGTALLALTAGVASPVLAVGVAFLGLGGTGVSSYLNSNEGSNILKNIFGLNVSLTHYKVKREHLTNLQFIQLNPKANIYRDGIREPESNRFSSGRDSLKSDSIREREEVNNNYIGICICVGNNVFLNEIFFFENDTIDFKSVETIRHLDSEYIDIWKRQFPVPISDLYLLKWESKLMASLHRMLLKLNSLSIYQKSLELYQITYNTEFTSKTLPNNYDHYYSKREPNSLLMFDDVRDSSGGSKYTNLEGSSGTSDNHCSKINRETGDQSDEKEEKKEKKEKKEEKSTEQYKDFYKDFKDVRINWPVGLIQLCSNLDNCWLVCRNRAETCGMLLANAICDKLLTGDRHISLVGYSFGARVIFYCLLTLFQRNRFHVVKDVVLMGLPSTAGYNEWTKCTCVVAGRIINVYNENDWVLAFLYRYTANYRVAGLAPVIHERVENYNVTNLFSSHVDYLENISKITSFLNIHI